jgi:hypothetical protein
MASSVPTLHSLSAAAAINAFLDETPPEVAAKVGALPSIQLSQLFLHLLDTYKGAKAKLGELERQLKRMPHADRHVFFGPRGRLDLNSHSEPDIDPETSQGTDVDPFGKALDFRNTWRYALPSDKYHTAREGEVFQYSNIYQPINEEKATFQRSQAEFGYDENGELLWPKFLFELSSSHLMMYRLLVTLGSLPTEQPLDDYKSWWEVNLVLREEVDAKGPENRGIKNSLNLYESKGAVYCRFSGTEAGADKALS